MKLLTKALAKKLPALYSTESMKVDDKELVVKFFSPWSNYTWYACEYCEEKKLFFGLISTDHGNEWGYFSLKELEDARHRRWSGLPLVERDLYFEPTLFSEL